MQGMWTIKDPLQKSESIVEDILLRRNLLPDDFPARSQQDIKELTSPYIYTDMEKAVKRIFQAKKCQEKVLIYGDYDVDGITSTALLFEYLQERMQLDTTYYLPDRFRDGYGLNQEALERLNAEDFDLLVTVDCGISAQAEIEYLNQSDIDTIITDHHLSEGSYPDAHAILNPKCADKLNNKVENIAGVGVVFKLCQALEKEIADNWHSDYLISKLDLVALGSIADLISLRGENRILVTKGLEVLAERKRLGLKKIIDTVGLNDSDDFSAGKISFILAPPFNAAGRLKNPDIGLQLLLARDENKAEALADELDLLNSERREMEQRILQEAENLLAEMKLKHKKPIVLASEDWHQGVIGIVASRLVDKYHRPVILFAVDNNEAKGSARSVPGINIFAAISNCSEIIENYGGHSQAAGLTLQAENITDFREKFTSQIADNFSWQRFIPRERVDSLLYFSSVNRTLHEKIQQLRPFGIGNPRPVFMTGQIKIKSVRQVGKDNKHLKLKTESGLEGIGFNLGDRLDEIDNFSDKKYRFLYNIDLNNWNGQENLQLKLKKIMPEAAKVNTPVVYKQQNKIILYDARDGDRVNYLYNLQEWSGEAGVYLHRPEDKIKLENQFTDLEIVTSMQGLSSDCKRLLLWNLPFSLEEIFTGLNNLNAEGNLPELHLLFSNDDIDLNQRLINQKLATREQIEKLWGRLQEQKKSEITGSLQDELKFSEKVWQNILQILIELEAIEEKEKSYYLKQETYNLDLSASMRYNNNVEIRNNFQELVTSIKSWDLRPLMEKLNNNNKLF